MRSRPPLLLGGIAPLLLVTCLSAFPSGAEERFHLFPETEGPPPSPRLRSQVEGLPPASPLAEFTAATALPVSSQAPSLPPEILPPYPTEKRFAAAALETIGLDLVPWYLNRYAADSFFAEISTASTRHNLQTGFQRTTTIRSRPTRRRTRTTGAPTSTRPGRTATRSEKSAPFALAGSFLWEMFSESQPPSIPDLVQTTLGGMAAGEGQFRIANMIFDNTKSGSERFLREAAGLVVNPMAGFNRLLRGEMWKDFQNPPDELSRAGSTRSWTAPTSTMAGRRPKGPIGTREASAVPLRYGDPFDGDLRRPFDSFEVLLGLREPAPVLLTRLDIDGLLAEWKLSEEPASGQRLALFCRLLPQHAPWVLGHRLWRAPPDSRSARKGNRSPDRGFGDGDAARGLWRRLSRDGHGKPDRPDVRLRAGARGAGERRVRRREVDLLVLSWSLIGTTTSETAFESQPTPDAFRRGPGTAHLPPPSRWSLVLERAADHVPVSFHGPSRRHVVEPPRRVGDPRKPGSSGPGETRRRLRRLPGRTSPGAST